MDENNATDLMSMTIIANSGDARSFAFQALESVKAGKLEEAEELLKKSDVAVNLAHKAQTDLLVLIHSQDHLMTSMLANELIKEIILLYKNR